MVHLPWELHHRPVRTAGDSCRTALRVGETTCVARNRAACSTAWLARWASSHTVAVPVVRASSPSKGGPQRKARSHRYTAALRLASARRRKKRRQKYNPVRASTAPNTALPSWRRTNLVKAKSTVGAQDSESTGGLYSQLTISGPNRVKPTKPAIRPTLATKPVRRRLFFDTSSTT